MWVISLVSGDAPVVGVEPVYGSPAWIRTTIHGSKGRCPTIRRPGNFREVTYSLAPLKSRSQRSVLSNAEWTWRPASIMNAAVR